MRRVQREAHPSQAQRARGGCGGVPVELPRGGGFVLPGLGGGGRWARDEGGSRGLRAARRGAPGGPASRRAEVPADKLRHGGRALGGGVDRVRSGDVARPETTRLKSCESVIVASHAETSQGEPWRDALRSHHARGAPCPLATR